MLLFWSRRGLSVIALLCAGGAGVVTSAGVAAPAAPAAATAASKQVSVTFDPVFEVPTDLGAALRVKATYDSKSDKLLQIRGIGLVAPRGELNFMTTARTLDFLDPSSGALLFTLPIDKPVRMMGSDALESPKEADFSQASRPGLWKGVKGHFAEAVRLVLSRRFPLGYFAYETQGENRYLTTYADLPGVSEPKHAQVSVLMSHQAISGGEVPISFVIKAHARERLSHSKWRRALESDTTAALGAFQTALLSEIEARASAPPGGRTP